MPKTILLADDSVTIQKVVGISFASEDVTLISVDNGDDAIARAQETRPDVILADVVMPGKNGYEVCQEIKADPGLRHIPVLLLTGTFEAFDEERARQVGAAGHIAKPFEAQTLVDEVKRLFGQSHAPEPAQPAPMEQPATPEPSNAVSGVDPNTDSFDFFDENLGEAEVAAAGGGESLAFDGLDTAFEFGEEELAPPDPAERREATPIITPPTPASAAAPGGRRSPSPVGTPPIGTVEIAGAEPLDDSIALGEAAEEPPLTVADSLLESDVSPDASLALLDPAASASEDSFDFNFDAEPTASADGADPLHGDDSPLRVDPTDLAQETVLDPLGASGYYVSSADLGPTASTTLDDAPDSGDSILGFDEPDATVLAPESFAQAPEAIDAEPAELAAEPVELADGALGDGETVVASDFGAQPVAIAVEIDPAATLLAPESGEPEVVVEVEPLESARPRPAATAARAESIIEQVAPRLREQIHDTLEKIAWESFGDLTDTIVRQSVERVEAIAWEVIPQLAETLINEEIRRMKDKTPEDD